MVKKKLILGRFSISFGIALFLLGFGFSIAFNNHYDVKKGSLLWYMGIDKQIRSFPLIHPSTQAEFTHIGGDSPNISGGSKVEYESELGLEELIPQIKAYGESAGFYLEPLEVEKSFSAPRGMSNDSHIRVFGGSNQVKRLEVLFEQTNERNVRIEAVIWK